MCLRKNVFKILSDSQWHSSREIGTILGVKPKAVSSRIRDLRCPEYGQYRIYTRRNNGVYEYRLAGGPRDKNKNRNKNRNKKPKHGYGGNGGLITISAGRAGSSSSGGSITITGGNGGHTTGCGGAITISAGCSGPIERAITIGGGWTITDRLK